MKFWSRPRRPVVYIPPVPKKTDVWVQMAVRVPAALLQRVKIHCVQREGTIMDFVDDALREKLRRVRGDRGDDER